MALVYLGIGSNEGDRAAHIERAVALLKENAELRVLSMSAVVETEPVGGPPQGRYLNAALKIETDLLPLELLSALKGIERRLGRVKRETNGPRPIDLDILFYDDVVIAEGKSLTLPHPRLAERLFVLGPLAEIAPEVCHPRLKKTVKELYLDLARKTGAACAGSEA